MKARDYLESLPLNTMITAADRENLILAAYPDVDTCTGKDDTCQCGFHRVERDRDHDDPYHLNREGRKIDRERDEKRCSALRAEFVHATPERRKQIRKELHAA